MVCWKEPIAAHVSDATMELTSGRRFDVVTWFTPRELDVLRLLPEGHDTANLATRLGIPPAHSGVARPLRDPKAGRALQAPVGDRGRTSAPH